MSKSRKEDTLGGYISDGFLSSKYLSEIPKRFPILIFHGRSDKEIPVGHGYRLFLDATLAEKKEESHKIKDLVFATPPPFHQSASEMMQDATNMADIHVDVIGREAFKYTVPHTVVTLIEPLYAGHNNIALFKVVLDALKEWTSSI